MQIGKSIDTAQQMILWDMVFEIERVEQSL